jgi:hypothetical protein
MRIAFVCGALSWVPLLHASGASTEQHVTFSDYSPLSSNAELARRLLSPLTAAAAAAATAALRRGAE